MRRLSLDRGTIGVSKKSFRRRRKNRAPLSLFLCEAWGRHAAAASASTSSSLPSPTVTIQHCRAPLCSLRSLLSRGGRARSSWRRHPSGRRLRGRGHCRSRRRRARRRGSRCDPRRCRRRAGRCRAAEQAVVARTAQQAVVACAAGEEVVAAEPEQEVGAGSAEQSVTRSTYRASSRLLRARGGSPPGKRPQERASAPAKRSCSPDCGRRTRSRRSRSPQGPPAP